MPRHEASMSANWHDEAGIATPVEMMYLLVFCIVAVLFLGFVGRLHAAGVQVTNTAQSAARAASQAPTRRPPKPPLRRWSALCRLRTRCEGGADVNVTWVLSPAGAWQGGSVTVQVSCTVRNQSLTGVWAPGTRTVTMGDTQPVDRYQR